MPTITCSAPGSIFFAGEYASLLGFPMIVCAINQRTTVSITPIDKPILDIDSDTYGPCEIKLGELSAPPAYQYTLASFKQFLPKLQGQGFCIHFHDTDGFDKQIGKAAAVTVALCSAFYHHVHGHLNLEDICILASQAISKIQSHTSYADIFASALGGVIRYAAGEQYRPASVHHKKASLPIFAVYSGYVTSKSIAVHHGLIREKRNPDFFKKLHKDIEIISNKFFSEIDSCNLEELGRLIQKTNDFFDAYEVHTEETQDIINRLKKIKSVYGAKISGAGMGGCIIGLGNLNASDIQPYEFIPLSIDGTGVRLDPKIYGIQKAS